MKPELSEVLPVVLLKKQIDELYSQLDEATLELFEKYGEGRFDFEYTDPDDPTKKFLKVELVDVVEQLRRGETVWRSSGVKAVTLSSTGLKTMPKSLK